MDPTILAAAIVAAFGTLLGALGSQGVAYLVRRREHLQDERIKAYREMLIVTNSVNVEKYLQTDLLDAYTGVELFAGSKVLLHTADELFDASRRARKKASDVHKEGGNPSQDDSFKSLLDREKFQRKRFRDLARSELGIAWKDVVGEEFESESPE